MERRIDMSAPAKRGKRLTITQVADQLGVSTRSVRTYISEGRLPAYRIADRLIRVYESDLDLIERQLPTAHREAS